MAARTLEAVEVDAATCICAHPPCRQLGGTRPLAAGSCRRVVRRRACCARGGDACTRGTTRRRRSGPGQTWILGGVVERGAPRGARAASALRALTRPGFDGHRRDVRPQPAQWWISAPVLALAAAAQQ